ncbi:amine oxidase [Cyathus striatus]|nr:amine oxidase [Cyathus striatus]
MCRILNGPTFLFLGSLSAIGVQLSLATNVTSNNPRVLILGGGVADGIDNFVVVDAHTEFGGRMRSREFGGKVIELGPNWIQGTQEGNGPANPIFLLSEKHKIKTQFNDWFGSITTFDNTGAVDYLNTFNKAVDKYEDLTIYAGSRVARQQIDTTARIGYSLIGAKDQNAHSLASEYYQFDWEYAQTPEQSSLIASSWSNNFTYDTDEGGFSDDNRMSIDQNGFKSLIQKEAAEFLKPQQMMLNATVKNIAYSSTGVKVTLLDGRIIQGDYALCTFSVGVLQNDDVQFQPVLPDWKQEGIQSIAMATYTKIFFKFPKKFWFDTEMALYADPERGRYPVWQSLDHINFFPGSGIVFVTVTGDYSERIEALPDSQVKSEVLGVLQSMWHSDPLFRGSYSNWSPSFTNPYHDNLRANIDRLYFAGEATSIKYFGFLHGAYFEGLNIATTMIKCIKGGSCADLKHETEVQNSVPFKAQ